MAATTPVYLGFSLNFRRSAANLRESFPPSVLGFNLGSFLLVRTHFFPDVPSLLHCCFLCATSSLIIAFMARALGEFTKLEWKFGERLTSFQIFMGQSKGTGRCTNSFIRYSRPELYFLGGYYVCSSA